MLIFPPGLAHCRYLLRHSLLPYLVSFVLLSSILLAFLNVFFFLTTPLFGTCEIVLCFRFYHFFGVQALVTIVRNHRMARSDRSFTLCVWFVKAICGRVLIVRSYTQGEEKTTIKISLESAPPFYSASNPSQSHTSSGLNLHFFTRPHSASITATAAVNGRFCWRSAASVASTAAAPTTGNMWLPEFALFPIAFWRRDGFKQQQQQFPSQWNFTEYEQRVREAPLRLQLW